MLSQLQQSHGPGSDIKEKIESIQSIFEQFKQQLTFNYVYALFDTWEELDGDTHGQHIVNIHTSQKINALLKILFILEE